MLCSMSCKYHCIFAEVCALLQVPASYAPPAPSEDEETPVAAAAPVPQVSDAYLKWLLARRAVRFLTALAASGGRSGLVAVSLAAAAALLIARTLLL